IGVLVLGIAGNVVAVGDHFSGFQHAHVDVRAVFLQPRISSTEAVLLVVLHQGDGLQPTAHGDIHVVDDDFLGGGSDGHQTGRALAVDGHAGDGSRQAGAHGNLAGNVAAGAALLHGAAHDHVLNGFRIDLGAFHGVLDGVCA